MDSRSYAQKLQPLLTQAAAYARAILRDRQDAEDAVQQAALRARERIHQYDTARPFKGWWFAVLRHCCFDIQRLRTSARTVTIDDLDALDDDMPELGDWKALENALAKLSEVHREILRLKYFGDLSYDELATALQIPRGTVMSRLHLARKALAVLMAKEMV